MDNQNCCTASDYQTNAPYIPNIQPPHTNWGGQTNGAGIKPPESGVVDNAAQSVASAIGDVRTQTARIEEIADRLLGSAQLKSSGTNAGLNIPPKPNGRAYQLAGNAEELHDALQSLHSQISRLNAL
jgi:hypothetical protein